jgi:phosphate transport system substrate-binding protein
MNRRQACIGFVAACAAITGGSFARREVLRRQAGRHQSLLIGGASAMQSLNQALAREFMQRHTLLTVVIESGGSLPAYIAASRGAIDLAAMTRALSDAEDDAGARHYLVAKGSIGIIVNRASPLTDLSQEQVRALLTGEATNWKLVGGPDQQVAVISRIRGSTTRQLAEQILLEGRDFAIDAHELDSAAGMAAAVAANPYAIGYIASKDAAAQAAVAHVAVDGVPASRATVLSDRYPYAHAYYLLLYGASGGARRLFVDFARSPSGQRIVLQQGLMPVC